ncbi:MAG: response regulator [Alphaproteobacteria bacterium]
MIGVSPIAGAPSATISRHAEGLTDCKPKRYPASRSHEGDVTVGIPFVSGSPPMIDLRLRSASVVLLEENGDIRRLVKSALLGIGFGTVHECETADKARSVTGSANPDLLVLDLDFDNAAVCSLIQDIRHARLGDNPFVVIIGLTHSPEEPVIQCALDAGTDDLVRKPVSTRLLTDRITNLIQNRKEFIATSDYVGPQRGKGVRSEGEEVAQVKVPNSLRAKATGNKSTKSGDKEIKRAAHTVTLQRVYSLVLSIITLADRLEHLASQGLNGNSLADEIAKLCDLVAEVEGVKLPDTVRNLSQITASMDNVMWTVAQMSSPPPRQFALLRLHAQAIAATMRGDHNASDEVATVLGKISRPDTEDEQLAAGD